MKAKLLYYTPIDIAYYSAKTCYAKGSPIDMQENDTKTKEERIKFVKNILATGHESTVEGINFTFLIESVSRSLLAQITRHRVGVQFSVQSQRYVKYSDGNYSIYTPPTISRNNEALEVYNKIQEECFNSYRELIDLGIPAEDARYVLPNATCTNITTTMNLRALRHFMGLRLCSRASLEIRQLAKQMRDLIVEQEPWLDEFLQPKCIQAGGICNERNTCGRFPSLKEIKKEAEDEKE